MSPATDRVTELHALLSRLRSEPHAPSPTPHPPHPAQPAQPPSSAPLCGSEGTATPDEPVLRDFLLSFLAWEATTCAAADALGRIERTVVDFNELRVCLPDELVRIIGPTYPRVEERAMRLRAALNELFGREHAVTLEPLRELGKREARAYLESAEGVPPYVAARVVLLTLGGHAAPVDGRIAHRLREACVLDDGQGPDVAAAMLERQIRAGELAEAYLLLQAWADAMPLTAGDPPHPAPTQGTGDDEPAPPARGKPRPAGSAGRGGQAARTTKNRSTPPTE